MLINFGGSFRSLGRRGHLVRNFVFISLIVLVIRQRYIDDRNAVNNQNNVIVLALSQVFVIQGNPIHFDLVNYNVLIQFLLAKTI